LLTPFQARSIRALSDTPLAGLPGSELSRYLERTTVRRGEVLYRKGDPSEHLFALVSGRLKLFTTTSPGREIAHEFVAPGELIGEIGALDGAPRYASAMALANSELAAIPRDALSRMLEKNPGLHASLISAVALRVRQLAQRAEDVAFLDLEARLERALVDLGRRFGEIVEGGTRIRLRRQDLADMLGVTRESVSRALASPRMRGRLELGRGSIVLR
jgi:CRP-like cAMP-binding protein